MATLYATISIIFCAFTAMVLWWSAANPERSIWPPKRFGWRARGVTWSVTIIAIGAAYMAGRESWNAWNWPDAIRWQIGFPLVFLASSASNWAIVRLGLDQSMGADRRLVTDGMFSRTRNPTYLANLALCLGWTLLAACWPAAIASASLAALYVFAVPFEEEWLERTYGQPYINYRKTVPRWF